MPNTQGKRRRGKLAFFVFGQASAERRAGEHGAQFWFGRFHLDEPPRRVARWNRPPEPLRRRGLPPGLSARVVVRNRRPRRLSLDAEDRDFVERPELRRK